ncbi:MAG: hypothetical protein JXB49_22735 [Bacteroidales bacterium]|nr:hypothetical protein [Bacteroidales bacterium]
MKILKTLVVIILLLLLAVVSLRVIWGVKAKQQISLLLLDKTVLNYHYEEHKSFNWVLKYNKYYKENNEPYSYKEDYFGFIPKKPEAERNYDLHRIKITEIDQLASKYDILYVIDARGVYFNEWYTGLQSKNNASLIYGGITQNDYLLIKKFFEESKPMICEYQIFESPTSDLYRRKTEEVLDIQWTEWTGRYFTSLEETKHSEVPGWLIKEYKNRNGGKWPFKNPGVILIKGHEDFVVLEEGTHLNNSTPVIKCTEEFAKAYSLPAEVDFTNLFEIVNSGNSNTNLASFVLDVNNEGLEALRARELGSEFPAIIINNVRPAFYFAGNFSKNDVNMYYSSIAGGEKLGALFSGKKSVFFWKFYNPLMKSILYSFTNSLENLP